MATESKPGTAIERLIAGARAFRASYYVQRPERLRALIEAGRTPEVLVIACSDSRVDPALLTNAEPGELFVVRNVANLVPPYAPDGRTRGTSAAIEFAVRDLGVRHAVVLGHSGCGGVRALIDSAAGRSLGRDFIAPWMSVVAHVCAPDHGAAPDRTQTDPRRVEQGVILASLDNMAAFPWIAERCRAGTLDLRGWWFDLERGELWETLPPTREFARLPL